MSKRRSPRAVGALLLGTLALALSACGGDGSAGAAVSTGTTASSPTSATAPAPSFDTDAALFTLADLPTGWVQDPEDNDKSSVCSTTALDPALKTSTGRFSSQGNVPSIVQRVGSFAPGAAVTAMQSLRDTIAGCTKDRQGDIDFTIAPASFPDLGDDTFAYLATGETKGIRVAGLLVAIRLGDGITTVGYADIGSVDTFAVEKYARRALVLLRAAGG